MKVFWIIASTLMASAALAESAHLEALTRNHPFAIIGNDFGVLNEKDIVQNEKTAIPVPFSLQTDSPYSYWQCFPAPNVVVVCDPAFSRSPARAYLSVETKDLPVGDSYLARDAPDEKDCFQTCREWTKQIKKARFVCISGIFNGTSGKNREWVFDRFKTDRSKEPEW